MGLDVSALEQLVQRLPPDAAELMLETLFASASAGAALGGRSIHDFEDPYLSHLLATVWAPVVRERRRSDPTWIDQLAREEARVAPFALLIAPTRVPAGAVCIVSRVGLDLHDNVLVRDLGSAALDCLVGARELVRLRLGDWQGVTERREQVIWDPPECHPADVLLVNRWRELIYEWYREAPAGVAGPEMPPLTLSLFSGAIGIGPWDPRWRAGRL